jgi:hypothetical protein
MEKFSRPADERGDVGIVREKISQALKDDRIKPRIRQLALMKESLERLLNT